MTFSEMWNQINNGQYCARQDWPTGCYIFIDGVYPYGIKLWGNGVFTTWFPTPYDLVATDWMDVNESVKHSEK